MEKNTSKDNFESKLKKAKLKKFSTKGGSMEQGIKSAKIKSPVASKSSYKVKTK